MILRWWFTFGIVFLATNVSAQVVVNEIMFDPSGSEFFDEYIELYNVGETAVDLTAWRIGDDDETDTIVGETLILAPGAYALILDAGYAEHSKHYDPLPESVLRLTVDNPTLGHSGLSNVRSERILLIDASGDTVSVGSYEPGNPPGVSEEQIDVMRGDALDNWVDARWSGGTPGAVNSVSIKEWDLALSLTTHSPIHLPWSETVGVDLLVTNVGQSAVLGFEVAIQGDVFFHGENLAVGDSVAVSFQVTNQDAGHHEFEAVVSLAGDQDPTNDVVQWVVIAGIAPGKVTISEVMAEPLGGSEWVELYNRSDADVLLDGWTFSDLRTTGAFMADAHIAGQGFVIVAEDVDQFVLHFPDVTVPVLSLSRWPRLNDGGDGLILRDGTQAVVDSVFYPENKIPGSLERVDLAVSGDIEDNWLVSQDELKATPGAPNSVKFAGETVGVTLEADPNPFVDQVSITYQLPARRAHANLWVFDRTGRRVASLLEGVEGGSQRVVRWDGRTDEGQILKPGIYVLYLEVGTPQGELFRVRRPVVFAKGLDK